MNERLKEKIVRVLNEWELEPEDTPEESIKEAYKSGRKYTYLGWKYNEDGSHTVARMFKGGRIIITKEISGLNKETLARY